MNAPKTKNEEIVNAQGLSSPAVYKIISLEGLEELNRPAKSLWFSGVIAGIAISLSLYVMAALRLGLESSGSAPVFEKFGYCVGFLIVILSRLQLFTENTITPVLPALTNGDVLLFKKVGRLWAIVFVANLLGTLVAATIPLVTPMFSREHVDAMLEISLHFAHRPFAEVFFSAIPAGFMIAVLVWMLPSSKGFEWITIIIMTFIIALTDTSHVIVGSTELFMVLIDGQTDAARAALRLLLAAGGNIVGGTLLFAGLAYAQVKEEI